MEKFLERYDSKISGVISTFDRMIFKGHIISFFQKGNRHHYLFEVSKSANERYLGALSAVVPLHDCVKELEQLAQPVRDGQNRHAGFNPLSPEVTRVFEAVLDGAHSINGFRNKDLRNQLFGDTGSTDKRKKTSSKITRMIRKLRVHGLISKIPRKKLFTNSSVVELSGLSPLKLLKMSVLIFSNNGHLAV